jgi:hypothetical protein
MPSPLYCLFAWAIENHLPLFCMYDGKPREFCPITLFRAGRVRVWQTGGESRKPLPDWRWFKLAGVTDVALRQAEWQSGPKPQGKVTYPPGEVDYDANEASPYNPTRSLGRMGGKPLEAALGLCD